jgi:hypothetical protein
MGHGFHLNIPTIRADHQQFRMYPDSIREVVCGRAPGPTMHAGACIIFFCRNTACTDISSNNMRPCTAGLYARKSGSTAHAMLRSNARHGATRDNAYCVFPMQLGPVRTKNG